MAINMSAEKSCFVGASQSENSQLDRWLPLVRSRANAFRQKGVEADDLIQEGLIGLLYAIRAFDAKNGASFETFAYVCITNRLRSAVISAGRGPVLVSLDEVSSPDAPALQNSTEDPQEIFISRERVNRWLENVNGRLSEFEKKAMRLYLGGYSYQEMAHALSSTAKAVDNALCRAKRKLRDI